MKTLSENHKQKIREAKHKYYSQFEGKRPYKYGKRIHKTLWEIKQNALPLIMKFNDLQLEYGEINEDVINKTFRVEVECKKFDASKYFE